MAALLSVLSMMFTLLSPLARDEFGFARPLNQSPLIPANPRLREDRRGNPGAENSAKELCPRFRGDERNQEAIHSAHLALTRSIAQNARLLTMAPLAGVGAASRDIGAAFHDLDRRLHDLFALAGLGLVPESPDGVRIGGISRQRGGRIGPHRGRERLDRILGIAAQAALNQRHQTR